jgi:hypothetical protein
MAGTGPQKYPGANTAHWWQTRYGGDLMEVNVAVVHTTEGVGLTDYNGGAVAPNLTAVANFARQRLDWYQHFDIDRSSRALQNLAGGVQTNTLNVVQVELEGTCDYSKRERWGSRVAGRDYIYWGDPPDWALRDLADFLRWLNAEHGVPLTGPSMWLNYGPDPRRPARVVWRQPGPDVLRAVGRLRGGVRASARARERPRRPGRSAVCQAHCPGQGRY